MRKNRAELATGITAAVVVFAAVPAVLIDAVWLPLLSRGHLDLFPARGLFDLLGIVASVAWVACCSSLLRSVVRRVRRHDTAPASGGHLVEWLAVRIAAAILVLSPITAAGAVAGAVTPRPSTVVGTATAAPTTTGAPAPAPAPATATAAPTSATPTTVPTTVPAPGSTPTQYTVVAGDSLWSIAQNLYDDGSDWSTIAQANLGHIMNDGSRFMDPSLIRPGWVLVLPAVPAQMPSTASASPSDPPASPTVTAAPGPSAAPTVFPTSMPAVAIAPATAETPAKAPSVTPRRRPGPSAPTHPVPLPELAALGTGVLLAAALARRARRARHLASLVRPEGEMPAEPSESAASAAADLVHFEGAPVLQWLEMANCHLTGALELADRSHDAPPVRLVRVGPDGVEVRLMEPVTWAPPGWHLADGSAWHLSSAQDPGVVATAAQGREPWLPVLLPVGDNQEGTWLVPSEPGTCLPVIGAEAHALVTAMRAAAESWAWSEHVVVTDDALVAETESAIVDRLELGLGRPRVLFLGDPASLSDAARARCSVVTTLPVPASDLTVTVDAQGASLHPLGVIVRPDLLDDARRAAVTEVLLACRPAVPARAKAEPRRVTRRLSVPPAGWERDEPGSGAPTALRPGAIEVRLLTAMPRIDGLETELPPKRARRAVELVAYLALHHPDPVTSDRLRTRVLGSADADAAAKTLFNTAGAARRAMGRDAAGQPFLPPATKSSHYRVSPSVTTDVTRATALVAAADEAEEPDHVIALLREALRLVEGEPLAGALSGYAWWQAEGHERRLAGTLVDAACRLAPLATAAGYVDLAQWSVEQARLVEPYSEALSRVAMRVAADAGDTDRLRREWQECQRRVDELDPGSLPTEATERLYVELRDQASLAAIEEAPRRTIPSAPAAL